MATETISENHTTREEYARSGKLLSVCIIGVGNVATHLGLALGRKFNVVQVLSRHESSAARLAGLIGAGCEPITDASALCRNADFYLIAVTDDAVATVVASTPDTAGIWAHTSGSVSMDVFQGYKSHYGVFYPLQTFTRDVPVAVEEVPFFIEGCTPDVERRLVGIASGISHSVEPADSDRRRLLHIAAVFACNFANLMWMEADDLLHTAGLDIRFLMPLLKVTLGKLADVSPCEAMTGPARRGDSAVIESHLRQLPPDKRAIYRLLSDTIIDRFHRSSR